MSTSYKSIKDGANKIVDMASESLERRSQREADVFVAKIKGTRGLWIFLHIPAALMVMVCVATIILLSGVPPLLGMILGAVASVMWWRAHFTMQHPFLSFIFAAFIFPFIVAIIA